MASGEEKRELREKSSEEEDLLRRSTKKAKGSELVESLMDDVMGEECNQKESMQGGRELKWMDVGEKKNTQPNTSGEGDCMVNSTEKHADTMEDEQIQMEDHQRKIVSYRDKLLEFNGGMTQEEEEDTQMILEQRELEDDDIALLEENHVEKSNDNPACPTITVATKEMAKLCQPWKMSLIIKLLGKRLGMRFLHSRLYKLWAVQGEFDFIDMENDYYLVRFNNVRDYNFVLQEGPWVIADHYLIVQR